MAKKAKPKSGDSTAVAGVNLADVERLLAFMDEHGLEEFEYARGGMHIRLKKPGIATAVASRAVIVPEPAPQANYLASSGAGRTKIAEPAGIPPDLHVIKSPIVGTFYSAPTPRADPFVTTGSRVEEGQVLCIIEAMKLMNEIESDAAGELVQIYAENGKPVEYGEPLFGIRATGKK
jgi:acetyl-CoA carboxylase biotin carboxyl carrier protein